MTVSFRIVQNGSAFSRNLDVVFGGAQNFNVATVLSLLPESDLLYNCEIAPKKAANNKELKPFVPPNSTVFDLDKRNKILRNRARQ